MKRKTVANTVMVILIIAITASGVLGVGYIKGRFDKPNGKTAVLTEISGIVTLKRSNTAYCVNRETVLHGGDELVCDSGASVLIDIGDSYIALGQSAKAKIVTPKNNGFLAEVTAGEAFVYAESPVGLEFDAKHTQINNAVALLSVRKGTQSVSVYYGKVENAGAGQMLEWLGGEASVRSFSVNSLNDFNIAQIRRANKTKPLIFTNEDLDRLEAERLSQIQNAENSAPAVTAVQSGGKTETSAKNKEVVSKSENITEIFTTAKAQSVTNPFNSSKPDTSGKKEITSEHKTTASNATTKPSVTTGSADVKDKLYCTVTIRCDTILKNWDKLEPAKVAYVPKNGCILPVVRVEFTKGETVFDVLKRVCRQNGIQLEYSWTPMYGSYYVEGINNLYEFDCGPESGWMYKVNGWFPNYGCSSYGLTGGEAVVWCYTCKGLGEDVGAEYNG